jgi:hypothetical protein
MRDGDAGHPERSGDHASAAWRELRHFDNTNKGKKKGKPTTEKKNIRSFGSGDHASAAIGGILASAKKNRNTNKGEKVSMV